MTAKVGEIIYYQRSRTRNAYVLHEGIVHVSKLLSCAGAGAGAGLQHLRRIRVRRLARLEQISRPQVHCLRPRDIPYSSMIVR